MTPGQLRYGGLRMLRACNRCGAQLSDDCRCEPLAPILLELVDGESGAPIVRIRPQAVEDCSRPGDCSYAVEYWRQHASTEWLAGSDVIRRMLMGYGAWDDLDTASEETLRDRALWVLTGNEKEGRSPHTEP